MPGAIKSRFRIQSWFSLSDNKGGESHPPPTPLRVYKYSNGAQVKRERTLSGDANIAIFTIIVFYVGKPRMNDMTAEFLKNFLPSSPLKAHRIFEEFFPHSRHIAYLSNLVVFFRQYKPFKHIPDTFGSIPFKTPLSRVRRRGWFLPPQTRQACRSRRQLLRRTPAGEEMSPPPPCRHSSCAKHRRPLRQRRPWRISPQG